MTGHRNRLARQLAAATAMLLLVAACGNGSSAEDEPADSETSEETAQPTTSETGTTDGETSSNFEDASIGVAADQIDWGVITDLSGPTTATQVPWSDGLQAYIDNLNERGGVHGRQVNLVIEDDQYDAALGQQAFERLVDFPVFGMSGINSSGLQVTIADQIREGDVPVVGSITTTRDIVSPFNPNYFATWCSFADMADVAVPYMAEQTGSSDAPRVVAAALDVASGVEWTNEVERVVESLGGEVTKILQPTGAVDASAEARNVAEFDPDFVAVHGSPSSAQALLTAMAQQGLSDTPVIGIANIAVPSIWQDLADVDQTMGENFEIVHCYTPASLVDESAHSDFVEAASSADMLSEPMFTGGWLVGSLIEAGLESAGSEPSRDAFVSGLEGASISTEGLSADVDYSAEDHQAFQTTRPYGYNYETGNFEAVGEYADYTEFVTDAYQQN